jgi:hypothetical protein
MTDDLLAGGDTQPEVKDPLEHLIGEGGKFYDADRNLALQKLAKGKLEADQFIAMKNKSFDDLTQDYLTLKEDDKKRARLEEVIDRLTQQQQLTSSAQPNANEVNPPQYDPSKIDELLNQKLTQWEMSKREEDNAKTVRAKLQERFGSNYQTIVNQQIQELGISNEEFNQRARRNPKDLFRTLGLDQEAHKEDFQSPPRSNVRTDNFAPSTKKRTWAYYQDMKVKSPTEYLSPQTQTQMLQDMKSLGEAFKDGNWNNI